MSHVSVIRQCHLSSVSFCHSFIVCLCFAVCFICTFLWCARCSAQCMFLLCAQQLWRNCISKSACIATFGWNWMVCRKYICKMVVMTCFRFFVSVSAFDFSLYDFFEARPCVVCVFVYVWYTRLCLMREERIQHRMHSAHIQDEVSIHHYILCDLNTQDRSSKTMKRLSLRCHCARRSMFTWYTLSLSFWMPSQCHLFAWCIRTNFLFLCLTMQFHFRRLLFWHMAAVYT